MLPSGKNKEDVQKLIRESAFRLHRKEIVKDAEDSDGKDSDEESVTNETEGVSSSSNVIDLVSLKWEKWYPVCWAAWVEYGPLSSTPDLQWASGSARDTKETDYSEPLAASPLSKSKARVRKEPVNLSPKSSASTSSVSKGEDNAAKIAAELSRYCDIQDQRLAMYNSVCEFLTNCDIVTDDFARMKLKMHFADHHRHCQTLLHLFPAQRQCALKI